MWLPVCKILDDFHDLFSKESLHIAICLACEGFLIFGLLLFIFLGNNPYFVCRCLLLFIVTFCVIALL